MITKAELLNIAKTKRLSERNTEKDYLLELTLYSVSEFKEALVLKGGTALYKFYNLNRFSEDLDFTLGRRKLDADKIVSAILHDAKMIGVGVKVDELKSHRNEVNVRLGIRGPLYDGTKNSIARITLNVSLREKPYIVERRFFNPFYRELPSFELVVLDAKEILAEKVRAIMTRNKPRDIYDLWFLLKKGITIDNRLIDRKLRIINLQFDKKHFYSSLEEKRGMWLMDLKALVLGTVPKFDLVLREIFEKFHELS